MTYFNRIRFNHKGGKNKKPTLYRPNFLSVVERKGYYLFIDEETFEKEKKDCTANGILWDTFLFQNKLYTDRLKSGGYKISKLKSFQPLSGYLQK